MELNAYQIESKKTALYPNVGNNFIYPTLGLCGEAGEVAEKIKKIIRDNNSIADPERINEIKKELGDVLWYIAQLSTELNLTLEDIAQANINKLQERLKNNLLHGNGDNR